MPRSAPKAPFEQLRLFVHFLPCRGRAKATIPDARQGGFLGFFQARVEPDKIEVAVAGCRLEQWFLCHDMAQDVAGWALSRLGIGRDWSANRAGLPSSVTPWPRARSMGR